MSVVTVRVGVGVRVGAGVRVRVRVTVLHPPLSGGSHALAALAARAPVEDERGVGAHEVRDVPPLREPTAAAAPCVHLHGQG